MSIMIYLYSGTMVLSAVGPNEILSRQPQAAVRQLLIGYSPQLPTRSGNAEQAEPNAVACIRRLLAKAARRNLKRWDVARRSPAW